MAAKLTIKVYHKGRLLHSGEFDAAIELGRQQGPDERLFENAPGATVRRVPIAAINEMSVSRQHVLLEPLAGDRVRVGNLSAKNVIRLRDGTSVIAGGSRELFVPCQLSVGERELYEVHVEPQVSESEEFHSLAQPTMAPNFAPRVLPTITPPLSSLADRDLVPLVEWLQTVSRVLQSASSSEDFFERAANAVVDLVGLDSGSVLLRDGKGWKMKAERQGRGLAARQPDWQPSRRILETICERKATYWRDGANARTMQGSLLDVEAVVASPILDRHGDVIGALYGDRYVGARSSSGMTITKPEAVLVETLACGVAAGLARMEQEREAVAARVRFEQFFSAELAEQLALNPNLLAGRDTEVTVLFADIRGFSRVSERLGAAGTMAWINDVLDVLSDCVIRHGGVLVDYVGDELLAMWGAPVAQPDHALRAARAAVEMWRSLPEFNARWTGRLGAETRLGIGMNSGIARVGNTGSHRKFKYGPLGNTVNLASRVQGATKHLRTGVLVTAATQSQLDASLATRRLCQVRVVNIVEPVTLFELRPDVSAGDEALCRRYEQALTQFESGDFRRALETLSQVLAQFPNDGPSQVLQSRAEAAFAGSSSAFSPVWELPGK